MKINLVSSDADCDDDDCVAGSELLLMIEIYCYKTALNKETFAQTRINNWLSVQTLQFLLTSLFRVLSKTSLVSQGTSLGSLYGRIAGQSCGHLFCFSRDSYTGVPEKKYLGS